MEQGAWLMTSSCEEREGAIQRGGTSVYGVLRLRLNF
jgi:hypothetical protein